MKARRYKWLDGRFVGTALKTVLSKTVIDQAVSAPIILVTFYTGMLLCSVRGCCLCPSSSSSPPHSHE